MKNVILFIMFITVVVMLIQNDKVTYVINQVHDLDLQTLVIKRDSSVTTMNLIEYPAEEAVPKPFITVATSSLSTRIAKTGRPVFEPVDTNPEVFIKFWKDIAIKEMRRSGIPASITLAQAALEGRWGTSELSTLAQNDFGIKCQEKVGVCKAGHCMHFPDDNWKDMFRVYETRWDGWKQHSDFLLNPNNINPKTGKSRYRVLLTLGSTNYSGWADGLQEAGYATSKTYASKLKRIIKEHNLNRFDEEIDLSNLIVQN